MIKIGIVGAGFVGSAVEFGFNKNVEKFLVDPKLNSSLSDLKEFDPDFIISDITNICVECTIPGDGCVPILEYTRSLFIPDHVSSYSRKCQMDLSLNLKQLQNHIRLNLLIDMIVKEH